MTHRGPSPAALAVLLALTVTSTAAADKDGTHPGKADKKAAPAADDPARAAAAKKQPPRAQPASPAQPAKPAVAAAPNAPGKKSEGRGKALGHEEHAEKHAEKKAGEASAKATSDPEAKAEREPSAEPGEQQRERGRHGGFKSSMRELRESFKAGTLSKDELKQRLQALKESRKERGRRHREALKERWGERLAQPALKAELAHHERRMAHLERLALLAETERQGAARDELVARIDKLIALENERHERKMKQLEESASTKLVKE